MSLSNLDINYQNYDLIFKDAFTIFHDQALDFLNIDLPPILTILNSTLAAISAKEQRFDMIFELADGTILHMEEEADVSNADLLRFAAYDLQLYRTYHKKITTLILCFKQNSARHTSFDIGSMQYQVQVCNTSDRDADQILVDIEAKIARGESINPLTLIFLPLMKSKYSAPELVEKIIHTQINLPIDEVTKKKIIVATLVLSDKLVGRDLLEKLWEDIHMYKFIEFAEEKGMLKGKAEGEAKGKAEGLVEGEKKGKIEVLFSQLTKKFKFIPNAYKEKLSKLDKFQVEFILGDIFEIHELKDLDKYLPNNECWWNFQPESWKLQIKMRLRKTENFHSLLGSLIFSFLRYHLIDATY